VSHASLGWGLVHGPVPGPSPVLPCAGSSPCDSRARRSGLNPRQFLPRTRAIAAPPLHRGSWPLADKLESATTRALRVSYLPLTVDPSRRAAAQRCPAVRTPTRSSVDLGFQSVWPIDPPVRCASATHLGRGSRASNARTAAFSCLPPCTTAMHSSRVGPASNLRRCLFNGHHPPVVGDRLLQRAVAVVSPNRKVWRKSFAVSGLRGSRRKAQLRPCSLRAPCGSPGWALVLLTPRGDGWSSMKTCGSPVMPAPPSSSFCFFVASAESVSTVPSCPKISRPSPASIALQIAGTLPSGGPASRHHGRPREGLFLLAPSKTGGVSTAVGFFEPGSNHADGPALGNPGGALRRAGWARGRSGVRRPAAAGPVHPGAIPASLGAPCFRASGGSASSCRGWDSWVCDAQHHRHQIIWGAQGVLLRPPPRPRRARSAATAAELNERRRGKGGSFWELAGPTTKRSRGLPGRDTAAATRLHVQPAPDGPRRPRFPESVPASRHLRPIWHRA